MLNIIRENKARYNISSSEIFYICYSLLLVSFFMSDAFSKRIFMLLDIILYTILIINIIFIQKYTLRQVIYIFFIGSIVFVSALLSENTLLLRSFLLIVSAKNINLNKFINLDFKIRFICVITIMTLAFNGAIENFINYRDGIIRYSWGFEHPNQLAIHIMTLYLTSLYLYNKSRMKNFIIFLITLIFINNVTGNRSCVVVISIAYILNEMKFIFELNFMRKMSLNLPILCGVTSIVFAVLDINKYKLISYLNDLFNTRVYNCYKFLHEYGISILGQKIEIIGTKIASQLNITPKILDNAYMYILISFGIVVFIIFIVGYMILIKRIIIIKEYSILIIIISYLVLGLMETYLFYPFINFTIVLLTKSIFKDNKAV